MSVKHDHFCDVCHGTFAISAHQEPSWGEAYDPWRCERCLWPVYREHPLSEADSELFLLFVAEVEPTSLLYPSAAGFLDARTMTERGVRRIVALARSTDRTSWRQRVVANKNRASPERVRHLLSGLDSLSSLERRGQLSARISAAEDAAVQAKRLHIFPYQVAWRQHPTLPTALRLVVIDVLRQPDFRLPSYAELWQNTSKFLSSTSLKPGIIEQSIAQLIAMGTLKYLDPTQDGPNRGLGIAFEVASQEQQLA